VECEALEVLGRIDRMVDVRVSDAWFEQAAATASRDMVEQIHTICGAAGITLPGALKQAQRAFADTKLSAAGLTDVIAQMGDDERIALMDGFDRAQLDGFTGSLEEFLQTQSQLYRTADEGDPRLLTWLSGDTLAAIDTLSRKTDTELGPSMTRLQDLAAAAASGIAGDLTSHAGGALDALVRRAQEMAPKAFEGLASAAKGAVGDIGRHVGGVHGDLKTLFEGLERRVKGGAAGIADAISRIPRHVDVAVAVDYTAGSPPELGPYANDWTPAGDLTLHEDLPGHADGGVFSTPHKAWIAEGGRPEIIGDVPFMTEALRGAITSLQARGVTNAAPVAPAGDTLVIPVVVPAGQTLTPEALTEAVIAALPAKVRRNVAGVRSDLRAALGLAVTTWTNTR
jgi:hypothetical protein